MVPHTRTVAAAGVPRDELTSYGITYEEMRPGCYDPVARLDDMDIDHVDVSLCFPTFPRFCGQTFLEAKDKELALHRADRVWEWHRSWAELPVELVEHLLPRPRLRLLLQRSRGFPRARRHGRGPGDVRDRLPARRVHLARHAWHAERQFGHLDEAVMNELARENADRMLGLETGAEKGGVAR
jgi:hypothetical protein